MLHAADGRGRTGDKAFVHLEGVSDEWLKNLQVEKVAGRAGAARGRTSGNSPTRSLVGDKPACMCTRR